MLKIVALSAALVGILAVGCASSDGEAADVSEANATATHRGAGESKIAHVYKPTCIAGEINLLTCETTNGKRLAVCASNVTDKVNGYIEFRYGTMAAGSDMTITYPSQYTDDSEPAIESYSLRFDPEGPGRWHYDVYSVTGGSYNQAGISILHGDTPNGTVECKTDGATGLRLNIDVVREAGVKNVPVDVGDGDGDGK